MLLSHLGTYRELEEMIRTADAGTTYFLLLSERRSNNRPSLVTRLERRLRAVLVQDLNRLFEELSQTEPNQGDS